VPDIFQLDVGCFCLLASNIEGLYGNYVHALEGKICTFYVFFIS